MTGSNFFGIDLGTTYSCVATVDQYGVPVVLANAQGNRTTPSVVSFETDGAAVVGEEAKNRLVSSPQETIAFVKRHMIYDASFKKPTQFPYGFDPVEISAIVLKKLVVDANAKLDRQDNPIKNVVITCPAYFDAKAKLRTRQAGEIAGLNVIGIINEPTAAAIAYGVQKSVDQTILVYDLGGGTFDVTILKISGENFEVIATGGDPFCGGYDWDKALAVHILDIYNKHYHTDFIFPATEESVQAAPPKIQRMRASLLLEAERIKIALSGSQRGHAETSWLFEEDGHSCPKTVITRQEFDSMTSDLLDSTIDKVNEVLDAANAKGVNHIDKWILVGGSSKMPQVSERLSKDFGCVPKIIDPDESVAKGAAIYAFAHAYEETGKAVFHAPEMTAKALNIVDVCSKTYGVGIINNEVANFIFANTPLPVSVTRPLHTIKDNTVFNTLWIYESESLEQKIPKSWAELVNQDGKIVFKRPVPANYNYEVTFRLDHEGLLSVSAVAPDGAHVEFSLNIKGVKNRNEILASKQLIASKCLNI